MELILATNNSHKLKELGSILKGHRILSPADIGLDFDCEETGSTFLENSLLKARKLFGLCGRPVIADDSGLCIPALGGEPGVFSARYGSRPGAPELESGERNRFLLKNMKGFQTETERKAFFVCCMSLILADYRVFTVQETMQGVITSEPAGCGGFGYDPVFFLPDYGKTVAELPDGEKNRISHRGRAAAGIARLLEGVKQ